jgi:hypothetical protein
MSALRAVREYLAAMLMSAAIIVLALWKWALCMVALVLWLAVFGTWSAAAGVLVVFALGLALFTWAARDAVGGDRFPTGVPVGWLVAAFVLWISALLL